MGRDVLVVSHAIAFAKKVVITVAAKHLGNYKLCKEPYENKTYAHVMRCQQGIEKCHQ